MTHDPDANGHARRVPADQPAARHGANGIDSANGAAHAANRSHGGNGAPVDPQHVERIQAIRRSSSYRQSHVDPDFMGRVELRPVRLQLELLKPDLIMQEHGVQSTVVVFGGTRVVERHVAEQKLEHARAALATHPNEPRLVRAVRIAENVLRKAHYYDEAREFAALVSRECQATRVHDYVVCTGGGPGIMEAANRGAFEAGAKSIGLNITLPFEQEPNSFITPELCFEFKYFAIRKMHFLMRAKAMVAFPGGFGTMDELFEALTLIQTHRMQPLPVVLFGRDYWRRIVDWELFVEEGTVAPEDLELIRFAETAQECWQIIQDFYRATPAERLPRGQ
jgi:uncharacterized protein (TIGR00730 family)